MTTLNDGGPAFPLMDAYGSTDKGMTLRDYFAAKALQGWLASYGDNVYHPAESSPNTSDIAKYSYIIADAMLAAREKGDR